MERDREGENPRERESNPQIECIQFVKRECACVFEEQREKKANHIKREKERKKARQKEKEKKRKYSDKDGKKEKSSIGLCKKKYENKI